MLSSFFPYFISIGVNVVLWVAALMVLNRIARALENASQMMEAYLQYLSTNAPTLPPHQR
jgi:hypothetical protein